MSDAPVGFVPGYIYDKPRIDDMMAMRHARGDLVMASQNPGIAGNWQRMKDSGVVAVILREAEISLLGRHRRPFLQRRGTCESRGFARTAQASLDYAIVNGGQLYRTVTIGFAAIYSLSRVEVGKNRVGSQDGAVLTDGAIVLHDYGVMTNELFAGKTEDQIEQLACQYASPGSHTPAEWVAACKGHLSKTFAPDTLRLCMDSISSGFAACYASGWTTALAGPNGLARLGGAGGHCRSFTGVYVDDNGNDQLVSSESWGRWAAQQSQSVDQTMDVTQMPCVTIHTGKGPRQLPPGDTGVDAKQFWDACQSSGEVWCCSAPDFSTDDLKELTTKPSVF